MNYVSVCSGIEAATVAWHPIGWNPLLFAEIAPFPSRVLAHHYPEVPNVGDFTTIPARSDCDLLVGGTPCQAFSVAGLRGGLADARGNLALEFMRLADRLRPRWIVWENVPGVLSSNGGRDFGSILGALAELGYGFAYRVLDAQFFGVPQRRRRVFLVGYLGDWRPAAAVLFERTSVRRDTPSRRKAREEVAGTLGGGSGSRGWAPDTDRMTFVPEVAGTLLTQDRRASAADAWSGKLIALDIAGTLCANGKAAGSATQQDAESGLLIPEMLCFDETQITHPDNRSNARGDTSPARAPGARPPTIAYAIAPPYNDGAPPDGALVATQVEISPALTTIQSERGVRLVECITGEVNACVTSVGADASEDGTGRSTPITPVGAWRVRRLTPRECERLQGFPDDYTAIPGAADAPRYAALGNSMAVPVMRWIGQRLDFVDRLLRTRVGS